jgi:Erv1 / Alr family
MTRTLPAQWKLQELLSDLLKDFEYITDGDTYLFLILDRYPPRQKTWSLSCGQGKSSHGYSCGMWKLFHTMSVNLVSFNVETNEERRYSTNDASRTIKDFIEDNERCIDCRENALQSFDRCEYGRCHLLSDVTKGSATNLVGPWAQLSLWLVEWHNGVNKMVLKRKAMAAGKNVTLADELGVLWPPQSECLPCWKKDDANGQYKLNPTMTFNWLKAEYGLDDVEVRKAEKYIMALHRKESRKAKRAKIGIPIAQSSIVVLVLAGIWRRTRAKAKRATRKKDDGESSSNDDYDQ